IPRVNRTGGRQVLIGDPEPEALDRLGAVNRRAVIEYQPTAAGRAPDQELVQPIVSCAAEQQAHLHRPLRTAANSQKPSGRSQVQRFVRPDYFFSAGASRMYRTS